MVYVLVEVFNFIKAVYEINLTQFVGYFVKIY